MAILLAFLTMPTIFGEMTFVLTMTTDSLTATPITTMTSLLAMFADQLTQTPITRMAFGLTVTAQNLRETLLRSMTSLVTMLATCQSWTADLFMTLRATILTVQL